MKITSNPYRGHGMPHPDLDAAPYPSVAADRPLDLIARCPHAAITPLISGTALADACQVGSVMAKDERARMGLGSFKALGAAYVIARDAADGRAAGKTYVTASAGNHGLSVAAGAAAFGAASVIYLSETVPEAFADRLRQHGADVVCHGATYEESMLGAQQAAQTNGWALLSDSSWPGYMVRPHTLMEGYLVLMAEVFDQIDVPPTHIFLQAGVGGLAGAAAALARHEWGNAPMIIVVELEAAPALTTSIVAGKPVVSSGPVSIMGRLDCKEPSLIALKGLSRDADIFAMISEAEGQAGATFCAEQGWTSTPSGVAGIAALLATGPHRDALGLTPSSRVLTILSEGPET